MLRNLPSTSGRPSLASGHGLLVALLVHAAVGAAIYMSGAVDGADSAAAALDAPAAQARSGARVAAGGAASPIAQGDSLGAAAAELALADTEDGPALAQAAVGILIQAPDTMRLGQRYEVRLSLPPFRTPLPTLGASDDGARARSRRNGISPIRHATLAGDNVVVAPRTSALRLADSAASTVWRWMVTPGAPGRARLAAEVAVVHYREGEERIASIGGVQKDVHVEASGEQQISRFFAAQWPGLLLLLLVSTIGWLRIRFRWVSPSGSLSP